MKAKKIAVRSLIILAAVVAVCMFFSGTIRTIVTAKVKVTSPRQGRLSQNVALNASLTFTESKQIYLTGVMGASVAIRSVKVAPGYQVKAGDTLIECELVDFDKSMKQLRDDYETSEKQLDTLKNKNISLRRTEQQWADAYNALKAAKQAELDARLEMTALLRIEGLTLDAQSNPPEGASDALKAACAAYISALTDRRNAETLLDAASRYTPSDDVITYIVDSKQAEENMARIEEEMVALSIMNESVRKITAPFAGYITAVNVKAGDSFDIKNALYAICPLDTLPILRANTAGSTLTITKGMTVSMTGKNGWSLESRVSSVGVNIEGENFADIELDSDLIKNMGGTYAMMKSEVPLTISYKASRSTTLLPTSAVRGSGEDRYVYIVRHETSAFGVNKMVLYKSQVHVLAEADGVTSVEEDLSYQQIAYMEDRPVSESTTVMEYLN